MQHAQSRLEFIPQRFNPVVLRLAQWLLPILLRFRLRPWLPAGISRIQVKNAEILAELYQQFQAGKVRFLMAFRHPEVDDPLCMLYLLSRAVPRVARQQGILLQYPIHSHFIYERGMLLWAGDWLGWFFSNLGGTPIRRGKRLDKLGIQNARNLFANAKMPIAVAPEGATNGHSGIVSPLEPGVAQFGFWCVEDLQKANRSEEVLIVPIALQYSYVKPPWAKLDWLLSKLEADCGLPVKTIGRSETANPEEIHYPRLLRLAEHLLTEMEGFYQRFYHQHLAAIDHELEARGNANEILMARLHRLQDTALKVAEQYFKLQPQGNFIDRCRRLEEAGWSYIYREDVSDINALPPFQRGLADWVAAEAELRMRHMRLVETFIAVTGTYVKEKPTPERFAETALLIFDMIARTRNNTKLPGRPRLGWRQALITVGQPISVTERWAKSQSDRRAVRVGVTELTKELHQALEQLIKT
ncbi:1-acyl-sn-glycerol-3-phosphate acyltransferase [Fischerella thermalis]|jgi:1-acyl-sn-glycerol-3-phosphate acyltransferase|uniref:Phospholipid/glycerol acyltransferase n=1 Tax=Fischerella thermalis JSC-11 TaxID=741277 RepID=G6FSD9_9CYAN|nr:1-acyl-sn-glycerol-3-phosphate acyltransferase [Fischerella thermalis]EHC15124.1 phospholipid/glycerol acyltransferase [Fischerella thermalis JSC-11]PLZ06194.1 glycerol acyltransferase [Fischerella thermalis WC1110]PLZ13124.1 glycerol acyltransferase [Fischerella thermalis WC119]PLZ14233.1 glycerol acyltransferase [Fischerella thermalis WC114]PLZ20170.1 glycerol acyltransferase [Fischerella thermalis WC157]